MSHSEVFGVTLVFLWAGKRINRKKEPNFIFYRVPDLPGFKNLEGLHQRKRNKIDSIISTNPYWYNSLSPKNPG